MEGRVWRKELLNITIWVRNREKDKAKDNLNGEGRATGEEILWHGMLHV